ncbi:MAG: DEAD/DEAH box helicase [Candidatus Micrarchaeia archaeon]
MSIYDVFLERFKTYTPIQEVAMPIIEAGKNCIVIAPTGAGKTEAAILPLLKMFSESNEGIKIIYITPLRALNRDMIARLKWLADASGTSIAVRHGDTTQSERARQARNAPTLLVTTPETLQSMLPTASLRNALKNVKAVIVDEIHELYYNKRGTQLSVGLERLEELAPGFQRIGLSATISDVEIAKRFLCGSRQCDVARAEYEKRIEIAIEKPLHYDKKLEPMMEKFGLDKNALARLSAVAEHIRNSNSALIFANTRYVVEAVGNKLIYINSIEPFGGIGVHHGSLDKDERIKMEQEFRSGKLKALIATSSLELGIDIGRIELVIQYGSPKQALRLVQRVGRSGHTKAGVSKGVIIPVNGIDELEAIAIAKLAKKRRFETLRPNTNALDVLANQICGIALDKGSTTIDAIHRIVSRSFAYSNFGIEELKGLLEFMGKERMIGFDGTNVTSGARTRMYYYGHLSVIPDSKRYVVKNIIDNRIISTLDEKFVASSLDEGSIFITKGLPWKVVSIDETTVSVEPSAEMEAAVPDWSGEDIPVSKETAEEVFAMLEEKMQKQREFFIPSRSHLFVEDIGNASAVYSGLGTQANEALARVLAYVIEVRFNKSVSVQASPYMVLVWDNCEDVVSALKSLEPKNIRRLVEESIKNSELLRYRFINIAKMFGIIDKNSAVSKSTAGRMLRLLSNTPVYKEAIRELLENYFDLEALEIFVSEMKKLSIDIVRKAAISPLTDSIINSAYYTKELVAQNMPSESLVNSFTESILSKSMKFICTYCGFEFARKLSEIRDNDVKCPSCGSPMVAPYSAEFEEVIKKRIRGEKLRKNEAKVLEEALNYAGLISSYGGRAAVALSVYGVGLKTAGRVLMMLKREEKSFFIDLLDAQKTFIRTKKYWSI